MKVVVTKHPQLVPAIPGRRTGQKINSAKLYIILVLSNLLISNFGTGELIGGGVLRPLDFTVLVTLGILPLLIQRASRTPLQPLSRFAGAFFGTAVLSTLVSMSFSEPISTDEVFRIVRAIIRLGEILVLALAVKLVLDWSLIRFTIRSAILFGASLPAYSVYIYLLDPEKYTRIGSFVSVGTAEEGILNAGQANFNELGALCATLLVLTIYEILHSGANRIYRIATAALSLVFLAGMLLTGSRSALTSAVIGIMLQLALVKGIHRLILGSVIGVGGLVFSLAFEHSTIVARILGTFQAGTLENVSALTRLDASYAAWLTFYDNPLLGVGYAAFRNFNDAGYITPENYYMEILADLGLVGVGVWLWYLAKLWGQIRNVYKRRKYPGVDQTNNLGADIIKRQILPALVCLLVGNLSGNNFFDPSLLLLFLVLCSSVEIISLTSPQLNYSAFQSRNGKAKPPSS